MGRRRSGPRGGAAGPDPSELEGFLIGVRHRLAERRSRGSPQEALERRTDEAAAAIGRGELTAAESALLAVADRLDADEPDPELREFPRGLVDYDAGADRGAPTSEEEDAVQNRLLLAERLMAVGVSEGLDVSGARQTLLRARTAFDDGDRSEAVALGVEALDELDRLRRERPRRGTM
jgi:hypothetical protein